VVDDQDKFQTASDRVRLDAFKKALKKAGQATVVATEKLRTKFGMRDLGRGDSRRYLHRHPSPPRLLRCHRFLLRKSATETG